MFFSRFCKLYFLSRVKGENHFFIFQVTDLKYRFKEKEEFQVSVYLRFTPIVQLGPAWLPRYNEYFCC